jgi:hypothetical protein
LRGAICARPDLTAVIDFGDAANIPDRFGWEYGAQLKLTRYFDSYHQITVVGRNALSTSNRNTLELGGVR